ncbi:MAG: hypothetical protein A2289_11645 [Deltaproteobacteria bacterium RIFOXYA12_FULL_58_15]|nr:MAG: hypothetical protein A2289_11645 [Deltaproteobacteria bacterium RIFOXYA12_FULL_58_15]
MAPVAPVEVETRSTEKRLRVTWDDGHESSYDWRYLRGYCPCAHCQGHTGRWDFVAVDAPTITGIEEVGNYALKIIWDDGGGHRHSTGIYSFDNLRTLCTCDSCRVAQGKDHPMNRMGDA